MKTGKLHSIGWTVHGSRLTGSTAPSPANRQPSTVNRQPNGYSVIELVVALAVVVSVLAVVPVATGYTPETQVNRVAMSIANDLREARSLAVKYGNDFIVTFDPVNNIVAIYDDKNSLGAAASELYRQRTLAAYGGYAKFMAITPLGINGLSIAAPVVMGATSNPIEVTFHANGSATNSGVMYLAHTVDPRVSLARSVSVLGTGVIQTWKYNVVGGVGGWVRWI